MSLSFGPVGTVPISIPLSGSFNTTLNYTATSPSKIIVDTLHEGIWTNYGNGVVNVSPGSGQVVVGVQLKTPIPTNSPIRLNCWLVTETVYSSSSEPWKNAVATIPLLLTAKYLQYPETQDLTTAELFTECSYKGTSFKTPIGRAGLCSDIGLPNDDLSSMKIPNGYTLRLFEHGGFQGASKDYTGNVQCLVCSDFNDKASSLMFFKTGTDPLSTKLLGDTPAAGQPSPTGPVFHPDPDTTPLNLGKEKGFNPGAGYNLVWSDEFNTDGGLNMNDWKYDTGASGWGNQESQNYTTSLNNAFIKNGTLNIVGRREGNGFTSARIKTQGKKGWKYGNFAASIKGTFGKGIWPAFWMLGTGISSVSWPSCIEWDIFENIGGGNNDKINHYSIHYNSAGNDQSKSSHATKSRGYVHTENLANTFHVYSCEWTPTKVEFSFDNKVFHTVDTTKDGLQNASGLHGAWEAFIIINLAIEGAWPGKIDSSTVFPQTLQVEWVRVYQK